MAGLLQLTAVWHQAGLQCSRHRIITREGCHEPITSAVTI